MLDLFSGIGGFSLAAEWVWGEQLEIEAFVEIDSFCQKVLTKNFPGVPIYGDIKKIRWVVADSFYDGWTEDRERSGSGILERVSKEKERKRNKQTETSPDSTIRSIRRIDLLTGGFPCQPFSIAGKRKGNKDDRYLWPEMLRTICEVRPRWIVAENVRGLVSLQDGMVFECVLTDLENEGYEVLPFIIPACSQNAPHRRERVWIVAHAIRAGAGSVGRETSDERGRTGEDRREGIRPTNGKACPGGTSSPDCHAPDTDRFNDDDAGLGSSQVSQFKKTEIPGCDSADTEGKGFQIGRGGGGNEKGFTRPEWGNWQEHWYEVATRLCRVDDGVPRRMDRTNRLKALGNAIVPQIAYQIFMVIKKLEEENLF